VLRVCACWGDVQAHTQDRVEFGELWARVEAMGEFWRQYLAGSATTEITRQLAVKHVAKWLE
jgi:hypothetical protein